MTRIGPDKSIIDELEAQGRLARRGQGSFADLPLPSEIADAPNSPLSETLRAMRGEERSDSPCHTDPEILGGTPVFRGTRVPARALFDYLEAGHTVAEFLEDFPSVMREQVTAMVDQARKPGSPLGRRPGGS